MRCTYVSENGTPCRAYARRGTSRCRHHGFRLRMRQGLAFRPSLLDAYLECPMRCAEQYFVDGGEREPSRAALIGTVAHEILAKANHMYRATGTWRLPSGVSAEIACGRLTASEIEELLETLRWFEPSYSAEEIVLCEPTYGHGVAAEPIAAWRPRWFGEQEFWGTPDLVTMDERGGYTIHDWKTGRVPTYPRGAAPIVYAFLLDAWHRDKHGTPMAYPVKVVWRWMRLGDAAGTRERLIYADDVVNGMEFLSGVARRVRASVASGEWLAVPNEFCGFCSRSATCAAGPGSETSSGMAADYLLAVGREKAAHTEAETLREQLAQLAAAGEDVNDPATGEPVFSIGTSTRFTHKRLTADTMPAVLEACAKEGVPAADVLRLDGSALQQRPFLLARLELAGVSQRAEGITVRRNGKAGVEWPAQS